MYMWYLADKTKRILTIFFLHFCSTFQRLVFSIGWSCWRVRGGDGARGREKRCRDRPRPRDWGRAWGITCVLQTQFSSFCSGFIGQDNSVTFNQCLSQFDSFKQSCLFSWWVRLLACLLRRAIQGIMALLLKVVWISLKLLCCESSCNFFSKNISSRLNFTLLHSERPKLYGVLAILSAIRWKCASRIHLTNPWVDYFVKLGP